MAANIGSYFQRAKTTQQKARVSSREEAAPEDLLFDAEQIADEGVADGDEAGAFADAVFTTAMASSTWDTLDSEPRPRATAVASKAFIWEDLESAHLTKAAERFVKSGNWSVLAAPATRGPAVKKLRTSVRSTVAPLLELTVDQEASRRTSANSKRFAVLTESHRTGHLQPGRETVTQARRIRRATESSSSAGSRLPWFG